MDMQTMTQIVLAWELHKQGVNNTHIATHLGRNRETVRLWLRSIQQQGLCAFLDQHQKVAEQPRPARQVRVSTKQLIWAIREREHGCCG